MPVPTIQWKDNNVLIINQTKLPLEKHFLRVKSKEEMWDSIKTLKIRGAPAIGIAAAFGVYLGIKDFHGNDIGRFKKELEEVCSYFENSRPTAVNLFRATDRIKKLVLNSNNRTTEELKKLILKEARLMIEEDNNVCRAIGEYGDQSLSCEIGGVLLFAVCLGLQLNKPLDLWNSGYQHCHNIGERPQSFIQTKFFRKSCLL